MDTDARWEQARELFLDLADLGEAERARELEALDERDAELAPWQTLAQLDHEYIARLVDGGTTDAGQPYLVMEYVDGEPTDRFAVRLELFIRIGQAVSHAHERGFIHRDLGPR